MAITHALALREFYGSGYNPLTCLKLEVVPVAFANGVAEGKAARAVAARHEQWARRLPKTSAELWGWIGAQDDTTILSLLTFCVARTVNAVEAPWSREPKRIAHADALATLVGLDMAAYWTPTVDTYLGRVTKARILEAVAEGVSERDAESLSGLKKPDMADHAERLLEGKGWLPVVLRMAKVSESEAEPVNSETADVAHAAE